MSDGGVVHIYELLVQSPAWATYGTPIKNPHKWPMGYATDDLIALGGKRTNIMYCAPTTYLKSTYKLSPNPLRIFIRIVLYYRILLLG